MNDDASCYISSFNFVRNERENNEAKNFLLFLIENPTLSTSVFTYTYECVIVNDKKTVDSILDFGFHPLLRNWIFLGGFLRFEIILLSAFLPKEEPTNR